MSEEGILKDTMTPNAEKCGDFSDERLKEKIVKPHAYQKFDLESIKVESGIPIPPRYSRDSKLALLRSMKPGDSFVVTKLSERSMFLNQAKRDKINVTTRKLNGDGYRIWRKK